MSSCAIDAFRCAAQVLAWLGRDEDALDALLSALALADHTLPDGGKPDLSAAVEATVALCLLHGLEAQAESLVSLLVELQQGAASRVPQSGVFEAGARPTPSPWSPTPWPTQL
ncbi:hypothetical protein DB32_000561 [Sandaracinus amylolyticus]|uniref:Uncharacterized protein n=2 Tax=Sandaracinus amylolyticus TaxID=927083 RepID=A0A0F6VZ86_9BACT|nr:hypothetical protein DB32_000561 [Sandaracinus amylolyticus]